MDSVVLLVVVVSERRIPRISISLTIYLSPSLDDEKKKKRKAVVVVVAFCYYYYYFFFVVGRDEDNVVGGFNPNSKPTDLD